MAVSDLRPERLAKLQCRYPALKTTTDHRELLNDSRIDAIVIATPVSTHFELAMEALHRGKHVLVEKPLAASIEQGERLLEQAARCNRLLMVDHTFVYTGAVRKIKELVETDRLGQLYYYDSVTSEPRIVSARRECIMGPRRARRCHYGLCLGRPPL